MDMRVEQVLEIYHERIGVEDSKLRQAAASGIHNDDLDKFLLPVGPDTGRLMNILVKSLKSPKILEIGTSYGYSTIWLGEAAKATGGRVTTLELQDYKSAYARDMAEQAGLAKYIDFKVGDALNLIRNIESNYDFVLLDLWKDLYVPCLKLFFPKLNDGAILVADNMIFPPNTEVKEYASLIRGMPGVSSVLLPVGSGIEVSRINFSNRQQIT